MPVDLNIYIFVQVPTEVLDMPVDPNEPTYCLCQQVIKVFFYRIIDSFPWIVKCKIIRLIPDYCP